MNEGGEGRLPEKVSIVVGIVSLALTIYFSKNEPLQILFVSATFVSFAAYFILQNTLQIKDLQESLAKTTEQMKKMEESLNIYERLLKLEREVFKNVKK